MFSFVPFTLLFPGICGQFCMDYTMCNLIAHGRQRPSGELQLSDVEQDVKGTYKT